MIHIALAPCPKNVSGAIRVLLNLCTQMMHMDIDRSPTGKRFLLPCFAVDLFTCYDAIGMCHQYGKNSTLLFRQVLLFSIRINDALLCIQS